MFWIQGWPFYVARRGGGCGGELWKLPQWFLNFLLKNEMRKLDIFQVFSKNVSLVAEAGCGRRA